MLKELKISNFRIFDEEVTVRFRPITYIIDRLPKSLSGGPTTSSSPAHQFMRITTRFVSACVPVLVSAPATHRMVL